MSYIEEKLARKKAEEKKTSMEGGRYTLPLPQDKAAANAAAAGVSGGSQRAVLLPGLSADAGTAARQSTGRANSFVQGNGMSKLQQMEAQREERQQKTQTPAREARAAQIVREAEARSPRARSVQKADTGTRNDRGSVQRGRNGYALGEKRSQDTRASKAAQSIALNTIGSAEMLGEGLKQAGANVDILAGDQTYSRLREQYEQMGRQLNGAVQRYGMNSQEAESIRQSMNALREKLTARRGAIEKGIDTNSHAYRTAQMGQEAAGQALEGLSGVGGFLGETALSIADNAALMPLAAINPALPLVIMSIKAAGSRAKELTDQGAAAGEALSRGAISGAIEGLSEQVSLGSLLEMVRTGGRGWLANLLKQAGVEGAEEISSYLANYAADVAARDPKAQFDPEEMMRQGASGALSGLVFGGVGTAIGRLNDYRGVDYSQVDSIQGTAKDKPLGLPLPETAVDSPGTEGYHGTNGEGIAPGAQAQAVEAGPKLSTEEEGSLLSYKSGDSYRINAKLRSGEALDAQQQAAVERLDSALTKLPKYEGTVYRNLGFDDVGGADALTAFLAEHQVGDAVNYDAFTSTSTEANGYPIEGNHRVHLVIEGKNGRNVAGYGNNMESEVLFPRQSAFVITKTDTDAQGVPVIYMQEVTNNGREHGQLYSPEHSEGMQQVHPQEALRDPVRGIPGGDPAGNSQRAQPQDTVSRGSRDPVREASGQGLSEARGAETDAQGVPVIYMQEVLENGQVNSGEQREGMQQVHSQEALRVLVRGVSGGNSQGDPVRTQPQDAVSRGSRDPVREAAGQGLSEARGAETDAQGVPVIYMQEVTDNVGKHGQLHPQEHSEGMQQVHPQEALRDPVRGIPGGDPAGNSQRAQPQDTVSRGSRDPVREAAGQGLRGEDPFDRYAPADAFDAIVPEGEANRELRREIWQTGAEGKAVPIRNMQTEEYWNSEAARDLGVEKPAEPVRDPRETANTEAETQKTEGLSPEQKGWYRELQTIRSEQGEDAAKAWVRENPMPETQAEREQTERATTELVADYYGEREAELYSRAVGADAADLAPGKARRPGTEHSGNVTMPSGYVGTEATAKLGIEVEAPITDLRNVERVRNADRQSREMERQIADYIKEKEASPLEIRRAKAVAAGEEKLENYRFTMHEPGNRKYVVEELAGLYRMQRDSDSGIVLRDNIRQARENLGVRIEEHLPDEVLSKAKPPVRTSLWTNTWRRNNLRTFGREAGTWVNEQFFDTAVRNEAGRIRWANGQLEELRFAEQLTDGENELVFRILDGEATIENAESGMDRALVQKTVDAMRQKYADYYDAINDFLVAHGYKEIGFIENYAPHMQPDSVKEQARIFDRLGFGEEVSGIPTEIAGRTRDFKPGKKYNPFFQERKGVNAKADAVESFNSYINYLSEVFYHTDDIQKLRVLENEIRARYSSKSVQKEYEALKKNKNLSTEERDARIDELLHGKANELGKFGGYATQLENYTNILAGKQTKMDRAIEDHITRNALNTMRKPVDILVRSSIPGNLSSAINQLVQLPQITAEVGETNILRAAEDLRTGRLRDMGLDLDGESTFLTGKKGIRRLVQSEKTMDKILDAASIPFEAVDDLASRLYIRAAYFQALDQGMKHEDAVRAADRTVEDIIGNRMKGAKPNFFADKNIVSKLVNTFQLEVANGWEHIKYDLPQQWKETARTQGKQAAVRQAAVTFAKGSIYAVALNALYEQVAGQKPVAFDWIGAIWDYVRAGLPEGDDEDEEKKFDWSAGLSGVEDRILGDLPYISNIGAFFGKGSGRLPLPQLYLDGMAAGAKELFSAPEGETEAEAAARKKAGASRLVSSTLKTGAALLPMGNQARKTVQGALDLARGARYSDDGTRLLYTVDNDSLGNWGKGILFGRSALPEARDYYDGGSRGALSQKQTGQMREAEEYGVSMEDFVAFAQAAKQLTSDKNSQGESIGGSLERKKLRLLEEQENLDDGQKLRLYADTVATDSRREDIRAMEQAGMGWKEISAAVEQYQVLAAREDLNSGGKASALAAWADGNLSPAAAEAVKENLSYWSQTKAQAGTYEKLEGAGLRPETALALQQRLAALEPETGKSSVSDSQRCMVIAESGLSQEEQLAALGTILSENSMAELRNCAAAGIGLRTALEAREAIGGMKADVDANGKAVSGSKKKKVLAYINGLDLGKEQKDALYLAAGYAEKGLPETPWAKGERAVPLLPGLDGRSRETESRAPMALPLPGMAEKKAAPLPLPGVG